MEKSKEVINDLLGYEGLKIIQYPDILNFSIDSCLVAYFVTINLTDKKIIDLGCGNGYIPLFLTLKTKAHIYGIDIQEDICDLARRSVALNNLNNQIEIINNDIRKINQLFMPSSFDVVVTNPPYFKYNEKSKTNNNIYQTIARHEVMLTLDEVCKNASYLLKQGGTFAMVHRSNRFMEIIETCSKYQLDIKRIQFIYDKVNDDEAFAILIEAKKTLNKGNLKIMKPLYIKKIDNSFTDDILKIYNFKKE